MSVCPARVATRFWGVLLPHAVLMPAAAFCLPASQMLHAVAPVSALYLPAPQSEHVLTAVAPTATEYLPASQLSHAAALTPAAYLPAGHGSLSLEAPGQ